MKNTQSKRKVTAVTQELTQVLNGRIIRPQPTRENGFRTPSYASSQGRDQGGGSALPPAPEGAR